MAYKDTDEQVAIIQESRKAPALVVEAFAGTGKTSTLKRVAEENPTEKMVYVAFNKAIKKEAERKMPRGIVEPRTVHSLAYGSQIRHFGKPRHTFFKMEVISAIENTPLVERTASIIGGDERNRRAAFLIFGTLVKYCNSADETPGSDHVPVEFSVEGNKRDQTKARKIVAGDALKVFQAVCAKDSTLPYTPDFYIKRWSLGNPRLPYDVILFDEAQDASPVMSHVIEIQKARTFFIGDQRQAIYGWRGAVDAMKTAKGKRLALTKSFRFGENIAEKAQEILNMVGEEKTLIGGAPQPGVVLDDPLITQADAVLCRGNAGVIREALDALDRGMRPHVVGGTQDAVDLMNAAYDLFRKQSDSSVPHPKHPELSIFKDWFELQEFAESEDGTSVRPVVRLVENHRGNIPNLARRLKYEVERYPDNANIIISTAHKAKGLEWPVVRMCDDFMGIVDGEGEKAHIIQEEANLVYVTFTRATHKLNLGGFGAKLAEDKAKLEYARIA